MINKKKYGAIALMMLGVALLAAACGGGGGSGTSSGSSAGGATLTFTGLSFSSIPGLSFYPTNSSSSPAGAGATLYTNNFANVATMSFATLNYIAGSGVGSYDFLAFDVSPDAALKSSTWYYAGIVTSSLTGPMCWVSGASAPTLPDCKTWGVAASRVAGDVTFTNTPVFASGTSATGTMSGTLTFPPF